MSSSPSTNDINSQLEEMEDIHTAFKTFVETKKLEPANATQLVKFSKSHGIPNIRYSQASKYFRVKAGLSTDSSSSQHAKPSKMYSKYYQSRRSSQTNSGTTSPKSGNDGGTRSDSLLLTNDEKNKLSKRRKSENNVNINKYNKPTGIGVNLETLIEEYRADKEKGITSSNTTSRRDLYFSSNNTSAASTGTTTPDFTSPAAWSDLTQEEKREIVLKQTKFNKENKKRRESIYLTMAANATDEHVEEVYDEADAAEAAAIQSIQENVQTAFKALVNSMKSHGQRLTQSKEQLQVIDQQMDAAKTLIVKEFDVAMGTLLKRRNGLLKALEVAHEENTKILQEQIKDQQEASNKLIVCKDQCKQFVTNQKTKEAVEAVVKVLNEVRPDKAELASINLEYKQSDPKLNDYLENYGTLSVAKTVRRKKNEEDAKADE